MIHGGLGANSIRQTDVCLNELWTFNLETQEWREVGTSIVKYSVDHRHHQAESFMADA